MLDPVLTLKQASKSGGFSEMTLKRLIARGEGPEVTQLSERRLGIRESHWMKWLDSRVRRNGDEAAA